MCLHHQLMADGAWQSHICVLKHVADKLTKTNEGAVSITSIGISTSETSNQLLCSPN